MWKSSPMKSVFCVDFLLSEQNSRQINTLEDSCRKITTDRIFSTNPLTKNDLQTSAFILIGQFKLLKNASFGLLYNISDMCITYYIHQKNI